MSSITNATGEISASSIYSNIRMYKPGRKVNKLFPNVVNYYNYNVFKNSILMFLWMILILLLTTGMDGTLQIMMKNSVLSQLCASFMQGMLKKNVTYMVYYSNPFNSIQRAN